MTLTTTLPHPWHIASPRPLPRALTAASPRLLIIVALVLLCHVLLLGDWPQVWRHSPWPGATRLAEVPQVFMTRLLAADSRPGPQPQHPASALPVAGVAPSASGLPAAAAAPMAFSVTGAEPAKPPGPESERASPAGLSAALARPAAQFPESTKLEFEGRGKEKGLISYTGSAELLWTQQGKGYETRLDIGAFGIRLLTWTSKGALSPQGLEPLRFGDRRRGPEVAAHFQRDKGLISFSTNRPDIPMQPGAQDKLSALLQLTALVSGAPTQYPAGSRIVFQAADAYRAEPWEFLASAPEKMELPGGTLTVMGFVKNPTVEFDQKIEVWLSPEQAYLPVRLRITEPNGTYSDLLWRKTVKPE